MATKQQRVCDVFPGQQYVHQYRITISCLGDETALLPNAMEGSVMNQTIDLSQKALDRLRLFIRRGMTAPVRVNRSGCKASG